MLEQFNLKKRRKKKEVILKTRNSAVSFPLLRHLIPAPETPQSPIHSLLLPKKNSYSPQTVSDPDLITTRTRSPCQACRDRPTLSFFQKKIHTPPKPCPTPTSLRHGHGHRVKLVETDPATHT